MALTSHLGDPRQLLRQLFDAAVLSAQPLHNMAAHLPPPPKGRTLVLGAGKAAGAMAHALEALWPAEAPLRGLVVTRYGHTPPRPEGLTPRIDVVEAAHPVPDAKGVEEARSMLALTQGLTPDDLVLCLISGGGSSLLTLPCEGLTLADKQRINQALLKCGASIREINTVRKHLSRIKGGRLAQACAPARLVTLAISDVPGDDPSDIASGPTLADASTCAQAIEILERYQIELPAQVREALARGELETPKPSTVAALSGDVRLIAAPRQSLEAAARLARSHGLRAYVLSDRIEGESREVAKVHAALARSAAQGAACFEPPCVILSGGETTVAVKPRAESQAPGRGGRAGEFCLGLTQALESQAGIWALAADTDGIDGVESNAGAWVGPDTLERAMQAGLDLKDYLNRNDSYGYFCGLGDLLVTGPTHTNVNDFRAILIEPGGCV